MVTMVRFRCETCRRWAERTRREVKYRQKPPRFCSLKCCGVARRLNKTKTQKVAEKAAYDRAYRSKNRERLKAKQAAYFRATYDPDAARKLRTRAKMKKHAEYCRRYYADPAKKAAKVAYDQARRDAHYGPFAEAHRVLVMLKRAVVKAQPDRYERAKERGYYDRNAQQRRRDAQCSRW